MEKQVNLQNNGQEVQISDLNTMGESGALADDRVFAELFRIPPYDGSTVSKAIIPHGNKADATATVTPGTGAVTVSPFRALIGSTTPIATDSLKNLRDIRSTIVIAANPGTQSIALAANPASGNRWDLVYAIVTPNTGSTATRYVKDPTSKVINPTTVTPVLTTTATIAVVTGTVSANGTTAATLPAVPGDSGGNYMVPLAYVKIVPGFTGATVVDPSYILRVAPILSLFRTNAVASCRPANVNSDLNAGASALLLDAGAGASYNKTPNWSINGLARPSVYMSSEMVGSESRWIAMDLSSGASTSWSHTNGAIIDSSVDWRYRVFVATIFMSTSGAGQTFAFDQNGGVNGYFPLDQATLTTYGTTPNVPVRNPNIFTSGGQSFKDPGGVGYTIACLVDGSKFSSAFINNSSSVILAVDNVSGNLYARITGAPTTLLFIELRASAPWKTW
jgi:hypothetical protein